jgi:GNAT superfamily N-acetyltransferase
MTESQLARARHFMRAAVRRQAEQIIEMSYGFAVLDSRFPHSYDHNKLVLTAPVDPAEAVSDADRILGGAGLAHRLISVHGGIEQAWADVCVAAGYQHSAELIMVQTGAPADRPADQRIQVAAVGVDGLRESGRREWREQLPDAGEDVIEQLVARRVTRLEAAPEVAFLAVRDGMGQIVSRADLYLDPADRVAQIEDVLTLSEHTGRGFARAIMAEGLRRAQAAGCDLVFVVADADDWPRQLYTRLGYRAVGDGHSFVRPPAP